MSFLARSWGSFQALQARSYLTRPGEREEDGRTVLISVLRKALNLPIDARVLDVGCGNGNLFPYLRQAFPECRYVGADVSAPLLSAGRARFPQATFVETDCESLDLPPSLGGRFDVAIYSHVIEMLESPQRSLTAARRYADTVAIEFFEPPADRPDKVELLMMDNGGGPVPYIRRQTSLAVYSAWVTESGFSHVDRYFTTGKYEVHVLK